MRLRKRRLRRRPTPRMPRPTPSVSFVLDHVPVPLFSFISRFLFVGLEEELDAVRHEVTESWQTHHRLVDRSFLPRAWIRHCKNK